MPNEVLTNKEQQASGFPYLKSLTNIPQKWNLAKLHVNWQRFKQYLNYDTTLELTTPEIFQEKMAIFIITGNEGKKWQFNT